MSLLLPSRISQKQSQRKSQVLEILSAPLTLRLWQPDMRCRMRPLRIRASPECSKAPAACTLHSPQAILRVRDHLQGPEHCQRLEPTRSRNTQGPNLPMTSSLWSRSCGNPSTGHPLSAPSFAWRMVSTTLGPMSALLSNSQPRARCWLANGMVAIGRPSMSSSKALRRGQRRRSTSRLPAAQAMLCQLCRLRGHLLPAAARRRLLTILSVTPHLLAICRVSGGSLGHRRKQRSRHMLQVHRKPLHRQPRHGGSVPCCRAALLRRFREAFRWGSVKLGPHRSVSACQDSLSLRLKCLHLGQPVQRCRHKVELRVCFSAPMQEVPHGMV